MELKIFTLIPILLHLSLAFTSSIPESSYIGINYGRMGSDLLPPSQVVTLLLNNSISHVKIFDTDHNILLSFANSGIKLTVCLPNNLIPSTALVPSFAHTWVSTNILPFLPHTQIQTIAVGNEAFSSTDQKYIPFLVTAMENIHSALALFNLHNEVKLSSPVTFDVLQTSYPSSKSHFWPNLVNYPIHQMLSFLRKTDSFFMINIYPFFAYNSNPSYIPLDYALFRKNPGFVDAYNGRRYFNLFDAQIDAVYSALSAIGFDDIKVVVSETGWPSRGGVEEVGAEVENAGEYNMNLVKRVLLVEGTPLRPKADVVVFLFALFNENRKPGPLSERNFGAFYPSGEKVYDMVFSKEGLLSGGGGGGGGGGGSSASWCVCKEGWNRVKLQASLDYACGEGGADCSLIQPHATCFEPDTLENHASFAFNSYYQRNQRREGTCSFGGAARVVYQQPGVGKCNLSSTP